MDADADAHGFGDWASEALVALGADNASPAADTWPAFTTAPPYPPPALSVPPPLLTNGSVKRFGQLTPPEERSPAEQHPDVARDASAVPLDQPRNEDLFPDHQLHALQSYQPPPPPPSSATPQPAQARQQHEPLPKRRRTCKPANHSPSNPAPSHPPQDANPPQPKRKRGRPKAQPRMVEAYTADGFPVHVSSARQSHLEKNRVAAHKCRQRKKEYIGGLEARARDFTSKNKALKEDVAMLREELLELKNEVLRHAACGFWAVDEYLARCAGDLLGMPTHAVASPLDEDEFGGLDLLEDADEEQTDRPDVQR